MGSTNAVLKYKSEDIYNVWDLEKGKYNSEIIELDFNCELPDGTEKKLRYRCLVPKRPFCYMIGYSALEGNDNCCIAEIKHHIYKEKLEEDSNYSWSLVSLPKDGEKFKLPILVYDSKRDSELPKELRDENETKPLKPKPL